MKALARYLAVDDVRTASFVLFQLALTVAATAFALTFSLMWPTYLDYRERSLQTIPWDVRVSGFFGQEEVDLFRSIAEETNATVLFGGTGGGTLHKSAAEAEAGGEGLRTRFSLVNSDSAYKGAFCEWTTEAAVLQGEATAGAVIIDAQTAEEFGCKVGDVIYLRTSTPDREGNEVRDPLVHELAITAIVWPDANFQGVAFSSERMENERIEAAGVYALDAFFLTEDDLSAREVAKVLEERRPSTYTLRETMIQEGEDSLRAQAGSGDFPRNTALAAFAIVMAVALLDAYFKQGRRRHSLAVFHALGVSRRRIIASCAAESFALYALACLLGVVFGTIASDLSSGLWAPLEVKLPVYLGAAAAFLCAIALQTAVMTFSLQEDRLYSALSTKRDRS